MKKSVILQRNISRDDGTLGNVTIQGNVKTFFSLELSDRGNANDISCIPYGGYVVAWMNHMIHGWCWQLLNVHGRQDILIHSANLAGNTEQGYAKQLLGCIALGLGVSIFKAGTSFHVEGPNGPEISSLTRDQRGITDSKNAIAQFNAIMGTDDFLLDIRPPVNISTPA